METVCFSGTLVHTYESTRRQNPEQRRHLHRRDNFKPHNKLLYIFHETQRSIAVFTADHATGSYCEKTESSHHAHIYFLKIHFNIILSSTLKQSLPFSFSGKNLVRISHLAYSCYISSPSHYPSITLVICN
jgi:hypothetical protein